jgi:hypothetical protein
VLRDNRGIDHVICPLAEKTTLVSRRKRAYFVLNAQVAPGFSHHEGKNNASALCIRCQPMVDRRSPQHPPRALQPFLFIRSPDLVGHSCGRASGPISAASKIDTFMRGRTSDSFPNTIHNHRQMLPAQEFGNHRPRTSFPPETATSDSNEHNRTQGKSQQDQQSRVLSYRSQRSGRRFESCRAHQPSTARQAIVRSSTGKTAARPTWFAVPTKISKTTPCKVAMVAGMDACNPARTF